MATVDATSRFTTTRLLAPLDAAAPLTGMRLHLAGGLSLAHQVVRAGVIAARAGRRGA
ncbi:hypothetical protein ACWEWP_09670 [Streptomyces olivaceus]